MGDLIAILKPEGRALQRFKDVTLAKRMESLEDKTFGELIDRLIDPNGDKLNEAYETTEELQFAEYVIAERKNLAYFIMDSTGEGLSINLKDRVSKYETAIKPIGEHEGVEIRVSYSGTGGQNYSTKK